MSRFFFNHGGVVAGNLGIFNKGEHMDDRKLLELAAKAAGIKVVDDNAPISLYIESDGCKGGVQWNPLTDDGDAFRLAVKLGLLVNVSVAASATIVCTHDGTVIEGAEGRWRDGDPYAATRRAIVRAAAAIGEQMP